MNLDQYGRRLAAAHREFAAVRRDLPMRGMELAELLYGADGLLTLREAAKRLDLSPTYLSQVKRGTLCVSPTAFGTMLTLFKEVSK